jgi:hypothetical protein
MYSGSHSRLTLIATNVNNMNLYRLADIIPWMADSISHGRSLYVNVTGCIQIFNVMSFKAFIVYCSLFFLRDYWGSKPDTIF